ncbi:hypothetical protein JCM8097_009512 [Rhodosporidiobolus ruineniae]
MLSRSFAAVSLASKSRSSSSLALPRRFPTSLPNKPAVPPLKSAAPHFLPVTHEEVGALRRQAFSSPSNDAVALSSDELLKDAQKLKGKVVLITGAGTFDGFGGQMALAAAKYGAKVVVSDLNEEGVWDVVREITDRGGLATGVVCDVSNWYSQVDMFRHAHNTFGQIDVVVANAGIGDNDIPLLDETLTDMDEPEKPLLRCLHIDMIGVIYTAKLAFYHLRRSLVSDVKAFVAVCSVSSYFAFPTQPLYAASKHGKSFFHRIFASAKLTLPSSAGVLGLVRALHYDGLENGIRCNMLAPWIVDTPSLGPNRAALADVPKGSIDDVVAAMIRASTTEKSGESFVVDEKGVFSLPHKSSGYLAK